MGVKEMLTEIRSKVSDEEIVKINSLLSSIEREHEGVLDDLRSANSESKGRKEKIRELKTEIEDTGDSEEDHKKKVKDLKDEIKRLKVIEKTHTEYVTAEQQKYADVWDARAKKFDVEESDPTYPKIQEVKHKFAFATEEEGLTPEQVKTNNALFDIYDEIGHFGKPDKKIDDGKPPAGKPNQVGNAVEDVFNKFPKS